MEVIMLRIAVAAAFLAAFATGAGAAADAQWKEIAKALDAIPSDAGLSVGKRIERCKFKIEKDASSIDTRPVDRPEFGARAGQTVLQIILDIPTGASAAQAAVRRTPAIWVIDHGKATPISAWAISLQQGPVPMGYEAWLNC
jgi:hypothetical protein